MTEEVLKGLPELTASRSIAITVPASKRSGSERKSRLAPKPAKHGDVIACATTACLRARLCTTPIRSRNHL